jgi:hypothetical protein
VARTLGRFAEPGGALPRAELAQTFTNDFAQRAKTKFKA